MSKTDAAATVAGENVNELAVALNWFLQEVRNKGGLPSDRFSVLCRAIIRIDAELLVAEADRIRPGAKQPRSEGERCEVALLFLIGRVDSLRPLASTT